VRRRPPALLQLLLQLLLLQLLLLQLLQVPVQLQLTLSWRPVTWQRRPPLRRRWRQGALLCVMRCELRQAGRDGLPVAATSHRRSFLHPLPLPRGAQRPQRAAR
jgi:hypothetical protein